jgi:hypothetical protein
MATTPRRDQDAVGEANLDGSIRHIIVTGQDVPQMMAVTPAGLTGFVLANRFAVFVTAGPRAHVSHNDVVYDTWTTSIVRLRHAAMAE